MTIANGKSLNLVQQMQAIKAGTLAPADLFYDWFCKESSLPKRAEKLIAKVEQIVFSPRFDATKCYVFFKNNCPAANLPTYDSFSICGLAPREVLLWVTPASSYAAGNAEVSGPEIEFNPAFIGDWAAARKFIMSATPMKAGAYWKECNGKPCSLDNRAGKLIVGTPEEKAAVFAAAKAVTAAEAATYAAAKAEEAAQGEW